ncbi:MAG: hypothetical protein KDA27_27780, partial [Candidatus Eisenbacteria bacterium]|nr:hypothetical protein [Candidatus Eisenbacteria bacterium]
MNLPSSNRIHSPDWLFERVFLGALSLLVLGIGCGLPADEEAGLASSQPPEAPVPVADDSAPRARLLLPSFSTGPLPTVGPRMYCRWDAFDQPGDLQNAPQAPSGFEYKLVEILPTYTDEDVEYEFFYADNLLLEDGNDPTAWIPVGPDVRALTVEFPSLGYRAFAVRAVDAMGQGEEVLERHRNYESFLVTSDFPNPELTVLRPSGYHYRFEESDDVWTTSVVPGVDFDLSWLVDASHYGAPPGQTKYAFDIADPEDDAISSPNGIGGWTDWARRDGIASPIRFGVEEAGTEHVLYVRARDGFEDSDFEILATIRIQVAPITFDRFALIVDDTKSVGTDDEHDAYVDEVLAARLREIGSVDYFDVYGDPEGYSPHPIPLELLGRYQVVLWHTNRNLNPRSGLELSQNALGAYMSAGGRVFLIGGRLAGLALDDFSYPKEFSMEYDWRGTFVWDRLHYEDTIVGVPTSGSSM